VRLTRVCRLDAQFLPTGLECFGVFQRLAVRCQSRIGRTEPRIAKAGRSDLDGRGALRKESPYILMIRNCHSPVPRKCSGRCAATCLNLPSRRESASFGFPDTMFVRVGTIPPIRTRARCSIGWLVMGTLGAGQFIQPRRRAWRHRMYERDPACARGPDGRLRAFNLSVVAASSFKLPRNFLAVADVNAGPFARTKSFVAPPSLSARREYR
jgi:hypothetical protein